MTKKEFNNYLTSIGGLVDRSTTRPASPHFLFGVECDDGWLELIAELIQELVDAGWTRQICQIKEKFGGLRFYADGLPVNGLEILSKYEKHALETCELCGSTEKVKLCGRRWWKTLCIDCAGPWLAKHF